MRYGSGERRARHAWNDLRRYAARLEKAQQRRETGKIGEGIAEYAQAQRLVVDALETLREMFDLIRAAAHEERGIPDEIAHDAHAVPLEVTGKIRWREERYCRADLAQRVERADREKSGIARTETRDA
jgi:hypothetical protein